MTHTPESSLVDADPTARIEKVDTPEPPRLSTLADLVRRQFPPTRWIVPGVLPAGLTILAGTPKLGKSWMVLNFGLAVANGGRALGAIEVDPGDVLYMALEDNERRLQSRVNKLTDGDTGGLDRFTYAMTWPPIDEGGIEQLRDWLAEHPEARLVVIDTLARIKPRAATRGNVNAYDAEYDIGRGLLHLAAEFDVGIVLVHHTRKAGDDDAVLTVSGTNGLTGGVDNVLVLRRERGQADAFLSVTGRDIEDERDYGLTWDKTLATWRIEGDAELLKRSPERAAIVELLEDAGPLRPAEIAERLGKSGGAVRRLLPKLVDAGTIYKKAEVYHVAVTAVTGALPAAVAANSAETAVTGKSGNTGNTGNKAKKDKKKHNTKNGKAVTGSGNKAVTSVTESGAVTAVTAVTGVDDPDGEPPYTEVVI